MGVLPEFLDQQTSTFATVCNAVEAGSSKLFRARQLDELDVLLV